MGPIWRPAVPLRLQVRPLRLEIRLLVLLVLLPVRNPIVVQLGQATPSVTQGARPEVIYGSQPHFSGQQYTAASCVTAAQPYTAGP